MRVGHGPAKIFVLPLHARTRLFGVASALRGACSGREQRSNHSLQLTGRPLRGRLRQPGTMSVVRAGRRRRPAAELKPLDRHCICSLVLFVVPARSTLVSVRCVPAWPDAAWSPLRTTLANSTPQCRRAVGAQCVLSSLGHGVDPARSRSCVPPHLWRLALFPAAPVAVAGGRSGWRPWPPLATPQQRDDLRWWGRCRQLVPNAPSRTSAQSARGRCAAGHWRTGSRFVLAIPTSLSVPDASVTCVARSAV